MRSDELIRAARKHAGLSQAELARRARTSQPAIARYEGGGATPSLATLDRILRACNSTALVGGPTRSRPARRRGSGRLGVVHAARGRLLAAAREHGVSNIRVFGSAGRGEEGPSSDVDLLVDLDGDRSLLDLIGFEQDAEDILGVPVDAVAPRFMKERIRARALREARAL